MRRIRLGDHLGGQVASSHIFAAEHLATIYRETLPLGCPPANATPLERQVVIRLVPARPALPEHFDSKAKEGQTNGKKPPRRCTPCIWAACSVFMPPLRPERIEGLLKLPNMQQMKFAARFVIDEKSGLALVTVETGHISLWLYRSFNPLGAIEAYEPFP
jgi:hypothetical protein